MKLVYIFSSFAAKGGTERIFCDKMNWLAEVPGYEIVFVTYEQGNHPFAYPLSNKIRHVDLNTRFYNGHDAIVEENPFHIHFATIV